MEERYKPAELPLLIRKYFYPDFTRYSIHDISYQQFCDTLDGKDYGEISKFIIDKLQEERHYRLSQDVWYMLPPLSFDIKEDIVKDVWKGDRYDTEYHEGTCVYQDNTFSFKYQVDIYHFNSSSKRGKTKIQCIGHAFELEGNYMHLACIDYFAKEAVFLKEKARKDRRDEQERLWTEFRNDHEDEMIERFSEIINHPIGHKIPCPRIKTAAHHGFLDYWTADQLDRGFCSNCTGNCKFSEATLPRGQHSAWWYEMRIDKVVPDDVD